MEQPRWSLRDFKRISLDEGASTRLTFELGNEDLKQFDASGKTVVAPGTFNVGE